MNRLTYSAPWSTLLKITTTAAVSSEIGLFIFIFFFHPNIGKTFAMGLGTIILTSMIVVPAFFSVLGYEIEEGILKIKRWGWSTRVDLKTILSVEKDPTVFVSAIRLFGIGGVYSFSGYYKNRKIGVFHSYLTDPKKAVVIKLADRVVVVSPDSPDEFMAVVSNNFGR